VAASEIKYGKMMTPMAKIRQAAQGSKRAGIDMGIDR